MSKIKAGYHGEMFPVQIKSLPKDLKSFKGKYGFVVVGLSETTGNDHRVKIVHGVEFYTDSNGTLFMKNEVPAEIGCVVHERHDEEVIPPGIWEFKKQMEFDPIEEVLREAKD